MATIADVKRRYPFLAGSSDEEVIDALHAGSYSDVPREQIAEKLGVKLAAPAAHVAEERTWGEAISDTGKAIGAGAGALVEGAGSLYGMATGDMDNAATELGRNAREYWSESQSDAIKAKKKARSDAMNAADGVVGKFIAGAGSTLADPALLLDTAAESAPSFVPGMAVGRGAAALHAARGLTAARNLGPAPKAILDSANAAAATVGTRAMIGTGAALQGASVSGDAYESVLKKTPEQLFAQPEFATAYDQLIESGLGEVDAFNKAREDVALSVARTSFIPAAAISAVANSKIPGGAAIERALVGGAARKTLADGSITGILKSTGKSAFGEATGETFEEGGGAYVGNVAKQQLADPSQDLGEGVGEGAGVGFAAGLGMGAVGGAMHRESPVIPDPKGPLSRGANVAAESTGGVAPKTFEQQAAERRATAQALAMGGISADQPPANVSAAATMREGLPGRIQAMESVFSADGGLDGLRAQLGDDVVTELLGDFSMARSDKVPVAVRNARLSKAEATLAALTQEAQADAPEAQTPVLGESLTKTPVEAMLSGGGMAGSQNDPLANMISSEREQDATSETNIRSFAERKEPMAASDAARILEEAKSRGMEMTAAPHPKGGFMVVPRQWVTPAVGQQAEAELADTISRMSKADAAPVERAPRNRTDAVDVAVPTFDPVRDYVDGLRKVNTPAAKFYVGEFDAGRIAPADVQKRMGMDAEMTPDQRLAEAAAQAPAPEASGEFILNPKGQPFRNKASALKQAKASGGSLIEVAGGYKVRKATVEPAAPAAEPQTMPEGGWSQFSQETGTLGVPRAEMPQVKTQHRGAMVNFLNARGVEHEAVEVDAASLKPTQAEFSPEKVERAKESDGKRSILISSDGHIIDGHHQALAHAEKGEPIKAIKLDAPAVELIPLVNEFPSSTKDAATAADQPSNSEPFTVGSNEVVLQNRDRTTSASIAQMNDIAAKPDYLRSGPSRDMTTGAPVVFGDMPAGAAVGRSETVVDGRGNRIQASYAVIEANDLVASNQADGTPVVEYANGVPGKMRSIAGNGRTAGLKAAYGRNTAGKYRQELEGDVASHGVDAKAIQKMSQPVLVRVMRSEDVTPDMGDRTNISGTQALSPVEQAANDARRVDLAAMTFKPNGDPADESVRGFVKSMPVSEQGGLMNKDGTPTRQAVDRFMAATFKQAYESDELVQLYAQATDPEARAVMSALADAAGAMAALSDAGALDIRKSVSDAAKLAVNAARKGQKLSDALMNTDLDFNPEAFVVAKFLSENIRSAKAMGDGLRNWAAFANQQAQIARENEYQSGIFGDQPTITREQVFQQIGNDNKPNENTGGIVDAARRSERQEADARANEAGATSGTGEQEEAPWGLTSQTRAEIEEEQARKDAEQRKLDAAERAENQKAGQDEDRKRIAQASVRAADSFELGQDPMDSLTGQQGMFDADPGTKDQAPTTEAADTIKLTQAEAYDLMAWQDLGTKDGVKTHILTFYASKADKDALRGRMTMATVTKDTNGNKAWVVGDDKFGPLAAAKRKAMEVGMAKAVSDGFVVGDSTATPSKPDAMVAAPASERSRPATVAKKTVAKIEDFGEKIAGAKKEEWALLRDGMDKTKDENIASASLSDAWPVPEYQKLLDGGMASDKVAAIRALRDEVPAKPRVAWKVKGWAENVRALRQFAKDLLDGPDAGSVTLLKQALTSRGGHLARVAGRIDLYEAVGHKHSLEGMRLEFHHYGLYKGRENVSMWVVEKDAKATAMSNWPTEFATGDTKEKAIEAFKANYEKLIAGAVSDAPGKKDATFDIVSERGEKGYWIAKKVGRNFTKLQGPFDTTAKAREFRDQNLDALKAKLAKWKEIPSERRNVNEPRAGVDMRGGADVAPQMFGETFGFRGVQFGNWVEQGRRQKDLNDAFDALMDMAAVLGIPPKAISLDGKLGLAFGARGEGGANPAAAHFEPDMMVINLTKKNGAGSLGHEWWHAVDNYFAKMTKGAGGAYMTTSKYVDMAASGYKYVPPDGIRKEMIDAFGTVLKSINATQMKLRSSALDKKRSKDYWTTGEELSARAFEAYLISKLQDQNASNDYLANIVDQKSWDAQAALGLENENSYPYPTDTELPGIRASFDQFFQTVQTKETDSGVAMFSRGGASTGTTPDRAQQTVDAIKARWGNAPDVVVVADMQDSKVPQAVRDYDAQQRSVGASGEPEGFWYSGKAYIVAGSLKSDADVARVLFHEVLGHYGLRGVFGDQLTPILKQIAALRKKEVEAKATKYGLDVSVETERLHAAEEVLAEMAQTTPENGYVKRAVAAIRAWLRKNIPGFANMKLSDAEIIQQYILPARRFVDGGGPNGTPNGGPGSGISFSRTTGDAAASGGTGWREMSLVAGYKANDFLKSSGKISWWHKTVGTQYNLAQRHAGFRAVFESVQRFIGDASYYSAEAAAHAPTVLPKLEGWKDVFKSPISAEDTAALSAPVFEGTLNYGRTINGGLYKVSDIKKALAGKSEIEQADTLARLGIESQQDVDAMKAKPEAEFMADLSQAIEKRTMNAGTVFSEAELASEFGLNARQIGLYKEVRNSIDKSLESLAISHMVKAGGKDLAHLKDSAMGLGLNDAAKLLSDELATIASSSPTRSGSLGDVAQAIEKALMQTKSLMQKGYAPLSRFGNYTLEAKTADGEYHFSMHDTEADRNKAARLLESDGATVQEMGTMSQEEFKLLNSISPESIALFGEILGLDSQGDAESDAAFQAFLQKAIANQSAMKRLIHRKGTAGYNEDVGRVLAGFVYSNGRLTSANLHKKDAADAAKAIRKSDGEAKDAALKLIDYVQNPTEEAQAFRAFLFAQYLGGSVASAVMNATQPLTMTLPYLSQFGGTTKAAKALASAMQYANGKATADAELNKALKHAEEEGIVSPQEIHQLLSQSMGKSQLKAGDWKSAAGLAAKASNTASKVSFAWGKVFGLAEQFNRRITFIAAYNMAVERGIADPATFAKKAVHETQGIYNKGNKPQWARGALGSILFTFKQFTIGYVEWLARMANAGEPGSPERKAGQRAVGVALGILFLTAGIGGLPGADVNSPGY